MPDLDASLEEVARALAVRGRLRRRIDAELRERFTALVVEERAQGASETEANKLALVRLGSVERIADEFRDRVAAARVVTAAQTILAGFVIVAIGLVVIAWRVIEFRRHREDGSVTVKIGPNSYGEDFLRHYPAFNLWLPPSVFSLKLVIAVLCLAAALVAAEVGIGLARRRWRLAAALASLGGVLLVAAVAAQLAFGMGWIRIGLGHRALLVVVLTVETVAVLAVLALLGRLSWCLLPRRAQAFGRPWMSVLAAAALLSVTGIWYGLAAGNLCPWSSSCELPLYFHQSDPISVSLPSGPLRAQGDLALQSRRLAVALTVNSRQPSPEVFKPPTGPLTISVWEASWSAVQQGPCGRTDRKNPSLDPLAPDRRNSCDIGDPASHPGVRWRSLARIAEKKPGPLALAYRGDGRVALAYYQDGAVSVATAPSWKPMRVLTGRVETVRIAPLETRDLVLAAITKTGGSRQLELVRLENGHATRVTVVKVRGSELGLVSSGSQVAILYRTKASRLVVELRTPRLSLLERRDLGRWTKGALGKLPGGRIGIASLSSFAHHEKWLTIFVARRGRISVRSRTPPAQWNGTRCNYVAGVVQTGSMLRMVGNCGGPFPPRVPVVYESMGSDSGAFVTDWPRYAYLERLDVISMNERWGEFDLHLVQPPELQLTSARSKN